MNVIGGDQLMQILGGGAMPPQENRQVSKIGDVATLAGMVPQRTKARAFKVGDFVEMSNPKLMSIINPGPYVVIKKIEPAIQAHDTNPHWMREMFMHTDADLVVGMIMRDGTDEVGIYREIYTWSGLLKPYELTDLQKEMVGIETSQTDLDAPIEANLPDPPQPEQKRASDTISPWGGE